MRIYLIGSLRNPAIPIVAANLRAEGYNVFDDWFAAGPEADDYWQKYETERGHSFVEALDGWAADHVYMFDKKHLDEADCAVLVLPAGKSGHLEFGYIIGQGKPGYILLASAEPERWDVMYMFADRVCRGQEELNECLGTH
jgi:nucleoside 2-deoxyribosyltransferase